MPYRQFRGVFLETTPPVVVELSVDPDDSEFPPIRWAGDVPDGDFPPYRPAHNEPGPIRWAKPGHPKIHSSPYNCPLLSKRSRQALAPVSRAASSTSGGYTPTEIGVEHGYGPRAKTVLRVGRAKSPTSRDYVPSGEIQFEPGYPPEDQVRVMIAWDKFWEGVRERRRKEAEERRDVPEESDAPKESDTPEGLVFKCPNCRARVLETELAEVAE